MDKNTNETKNVRASSDAGQSKMAAEPIIPLVISCSLPLVVSLLVQGLYNLVDSFFVARISEEALTATSLASPIQLLMVAVSVGTGVGVNSLLSRCLGKGDRDEAGTIATTGLLLAVFSSLVFILFGLFFSEGFLAAYTDDFELLRLSESYLFIVTVFCPGIFLATMGERLLQATGNSVLSMISQVVGAVVNCVLDPVLIFGLFGLPGLGVAGAAIATVISQWLSVGISLFMNFRLNHEFKFRFKGFRLKKDIVAGIYEVGAPAMLESGVTSVEALFLNQILMGVSTTAVAFFGLYNKIQSFVLMPLNGLAQGQIPIVGYSYGAGRGDRIMETLKVSMSAGVIFMSAVTVIFEVFTEPILLLFDAGSEMLEVGVNAMRIMASTYVFIAVTTIIGNLFTGIGNGVVNMLCTGLRGLLPIPLIAVTVKILPIDAVWYAFPVSNTFAVVLCGVLFVRGYKKMIKPILAEPEKVKKEQHTMRHAKMNVSGKQA